MHLGLSSSYLFGGIKEEEIDIINESVLYTSEENYYNGFRLGLGIQYDFSNKISLGGIVNLPTKLKGDQTRTIHVNNLEPENTVDNIADFKIPLEIGFGMHIKLNERTFFNVDYKRNFWTATNQSDFIGEFVDQDFIGIGAEYTPKENGINYWQRINYRFGFNTDNGNLAIKDDRITNYAINIGLGLPISKRRQSSINLGYSYGQKGAVSNGLIKENNHILTLNFSLHDLWFQKRKFN